MPFGQVPVLEVDGKRLTQSMSILRYIARKHGLEADDEWDRAVGDELATSWLDMYTRSASAWSEPDKELKVWRGCTLEYLIIITNIILDIFLEAKIPASY